MESTNKRISNDKKAATTQILVFPFKQNAWANTTTFVEWVERTLSKAVTDDYRFGLFCNNLKKQYRNLRVLFGTDYPQQQIYGSQLMLVMHNSLSP